MSEDFILELCGNKAAWQVMPEEIDEVNLEAVGARIEADGYEVGIKTRLAWTFRGPADLTLYPTGKLLVKTADKELAAQIASKHVTDWVK